MGKDGFASSASSTATESTLAACRAKASPPANAAARMLSYVGQRTRSPQSAEKSGATSPRQPPKHP
eukprot:6960384-Prorocentrum_lima.AAC.1